MTLFLASALNASAQPLTVVRDDGVGPVVTGMALQQVEQVLRARMRISKDQDPSGVCVYAVRADGRDPGIQYMVVDGRVQRVDIALRGQPNVRTAADVAGGASPLAVRQAYGNRAKADPTDGAGVEDLLVEESGAMRGMRFVFEDGRLAWIIAGAEPALFDYEGCL